MIGKKQAYDGTSIGYQMEWKAQCMDRSILQGSKTSLELIIQMLIAQGIPL